DDKQQAVELYETIPVYLVDPHQVDPQKKGKDDPQTKIEFQIGNKWAEATAAYTQEVKAIRITRFSGAVIVTFEKPCRAKLSRKEFANVYVSKVKCRNVVIDLLESDGKPAAVKGEKRVSYRIEPQS